MKNFQIQLDIPNYTRYQVSTVSLLVVKSELSSVEKFYQFAIFIIVNEILTTKDWIIEYKRGVRS